MPASENIDTIRQQLWDKMRNKEYRDTFVAAHLSTNIAAQIQTLRENRGWMQKDLADKTGMTQARISIMENPAYDKFTLSTLKRIASAFDVALTVRFSAFSELVYWVSDLSPEKIEVPSYTDDSLEQESKRDDIFAAIRAPSEQISLGSIFPEESGQSDRFALPAKSMLGTDPREQRIEIDKMKAYQRQGLPPYAELVRHS
jgi:transcriptional regulator with XRE-family HTH domain